MNNHHHQNTNLHGAIEQSPFRNQSELAEAIDVTQGAVSRWVTGDAMPRGLVLKRLMQVLKVDKPETLFPLRRQKQTKEGLLSVRLLRVNRREGK